MNRRDFVKLAGLSPLVKDFSSEVITDEVTESPVEDDIHEENFHGYVFNSTFPSCDMDDTEKEVQVGIMRSLRRLGVSF